MEFELTTDQKIALYKLGNWYNLNKSQVFILSGYAGTGKSTLISHFTDLVKINPNEFIYAAYTGKACNVLNSKGCNARTIHHLIYDPRKDKDGNLYFVKKDPEKLQQYKLIIVDEYSMIGHQVYQDLLSFGIRLILVGDPGQLPPVNDYLSVGEPDAVLRTITRQSNDSPILYLATRIRCGDTIGYGKLSDDVMIVHKEDLPPEIYIDPSLQVICGYNSTKYEINDNCRKLLKHYGRYPEIGDRVICTANDWSFMFNDNMSLTNGMMGTVTKVIFPEDIDYTGDPDNAMIDFDSSEVLNPKDPRWLTFTMKVRFDGFNYPVPVKVNRQCFDNSIMNYDEMEGHWFEYSWAISAHKSQGSEFDNVLVLYEPVGDKLKWLYTAVTRAKKGLIIAM